MMENLVSLAQHIEFRRTMPKACPSCGTPMVGYKATSPERTLIWECPADREHWEVERV